MRRWTGISPKCLNSTTLLSYLVVGLILSIFYFSPAFATGDDDFNDNAINTTQWGVPDDTQGNGELDEANQRLEYTCNSGTSEDYAIRSWVFTQMPYSADWDIYLDVTNITTPAEAGQLSSFGIKGTKANSMDHEIYAELYASTWDGPPLRRGFASGLYTGGPEVGYADSGGLGAVNGAVRMHFDSATKVITVFYDANILDGYQWVEYGSFGIAGSGGTNGTTDWGLTDDDAFYIYLYGYSTEMRVTSGQLFGDKFIEEGGVPRPGPPRPEITGPTNAFPFDTCSYFDPPLFEWTLPSSFQKLELQFYTAGKEAKPTKVKVKDPAATQLLIPANTWKKILGLPGPSGGEVNCRIVGTNKGEPAVESDVYTITIAPPEPVATPVIDPTNQTELPMLGWGNACATKFKVYFSPDDTFARKKTLTFNDKNPLDNGEYFSTMLTQGTWNAIRKLVNDEVPSTIWWYVESWDALKRYQRTGNMQFILVEGP